MTLESYLNAQKGKTNWKMLRHIHKAALWPLTVPNNWAASIQLIKVFVLLPKNVQKHSF
jgi:hypothetical protein